MPGNPRAVIPAVFPRAIRARARQRARMVRTGRVEVLAPLLLAGVKRVHLRVTQTRPEA